MRDESLDKACKVKRKCYVAWPELQFFPQPLLDLPPSTAIWLSPRISVQCSSLVYLVAVFGISFRVRDGSDGIGWCEV